MSLDVAEGDLVVVVGPSGSGKSTLLRCIAGLEPIDAGTIEVKGRDVGAVPPGRRDVAMVFQEHALYPHLDVATNISFPLRARKMAGPAVDEKVRRVAALLDISELLRRRPAELSGGERRRVSIARAVVREPAAFLMDEPLSNLDAALKLRVQGEIRALQQELGTTMLYVTHDQVEAMSLGHRLVVLRDGRVEQVGTPIELYDEPSNVFVASFLGRIPMNLLPGTLLNEAAPTIGIRSESIRLGAPGTGSLDASVIALDELGSDVLVELDVAGHRFLVSAPRPSAPRPGDRVGLDLDHRARHRFDTDGSRVP